MTALAAELEAAWGQAPSVPSTLYEARALMLELQQLQAEQAEQDELQARIADSYQHATQQRSQRTEALRAALLQYVQHTGKPAKVPDVGTAYATTRKAKVRVVEDDQAVNVARELDPDGTAGLWKPRVSRTGMAAHAQAHLEQTGEILPGCELAPASTSLSIRYTKEP